jgi:BirA family transcriptional regulator, biotin operon repressor / biotin---[acetyl-CoA-carboxylase] ligase
MLNNEYFTALDTVDSTNNYAMAQIDSGLAKDGMAYFANEQTNGKGQRGKVWSSQKGQNIILSVVFAIEKLQLPQPYLFNMLIAYTVQQFFNDFTSGSTKIKWPNDIYYNDRKAGGILIENKHFGKNWQWSVVGIGLNINEEKFGDELINPVSLWQITKQKYNVVELARQLHKKLVAIENFDTKKIIENYEAVLYKKNEKVKLKKENIVFETTIKNVDENGLLHTKDFMERVFDFGEVEWVM